MAHAKIELAIRRFKLRTFKLHHRFSLLLLISVLAFSLYACATVGSAPRQSHAFNDAATTIAIPLSHSDESLEQLALRHIEHRREIAAFILDTPAGADGFPRCPTSEEMSQSIYTDWYTVRLETAENAGPESKFPATLSCAAQLYALETDDYQVTFAELVEAGFVPYTDLLTDSAAGASPIGNARVFSLNQSVLREIGSLEWSRRVRAEEVMAAFRHDIRMLDKNAVLPRSASVLFVSISEADSSV